MRLLLYVCLACLSAACSTGNRAKDIYTDTSFVSEDSVTADDYASVIEITDQGTPLVMEIKRDKPVFNLEVDSEDESWTTDRGVPATEKWIAPVRLKVVSDRYKGLPLNQIAQSLPAPTAEIVGMAGNVILSPLTLGPHDRQLLYQMLSGGEGTEDEICFTLYTALPPSAGDNRDDMFNSASVIRLRTDADFPW